MGHNFVKCKSGIGKLKHVNLENLKQTGCKTKGILPVPFNKPVFVFLNVCQASDCQFCFSEHLLAKMYCWQSIWCHSFALYDHWNNISCYFPDFFALFTINTSVLLPSLTSDGPLSCLYGIFWLADFLLWWTGPLLTKFSSSGGPLSFCIAHFDWLIFYFDCLTNSLPFFFLW
jgi:hypothetical protein